MRLERGLSAEIPVCASFASLTPLCDRLSAAPEGQAFEVVLVDDGSAQESWATTRRLGTRPVVRSIRPSRNSGQPAALLDDIRTARHGTLATLDDHRQNSPKEFRRLRQALDDLVDPDLVYGWPQNRPHRLWRRAVSAAPRSPGAQASDRIGPFCAPCARLRDGCSGSVGTEVAINALLAWSRTRSTAIEVAHHERSDGRSGYSLTTLRRFALDVITGYSTVPLRIVTRLGVLSALFGFGVLVYVVGSYFMRGTRVAGFPFLASMIALFSGTQMLSIGIIGEYLGRTHARVMGRPAYVIAESVGGVGDGAHGGNAA